eukprot:530529-Hanusia_phi.AAC.1
MSEESQKSPPLSTLHGATLFSLLLSSSPLLSSPPLLIPSTYHDAVAFLGTEKVSCCVSNPSKILEERRV